MFHQMSNTLKNAKRFYHKESFYAWNILFVCHIKLFNFVWCTRICNYFETPPPLPPGIDKAYLWSAYYTISWLVGVLFVRNLEFIFLHPVPSMLACTWHVLKSCSTVFLFHKTPWFVHIVYSQSFSADMYINLPMKCSCVYYIIILYYVQSGD